MEDLNMHRVAHLLEFKEETNKQRFLFKALSLGLENISAWR